MSNERSEDFIYTEMLPAKFDEGKYPMFTSAPDDFYQYHHVNAYPRQDDRIRDLWLNILGQALYDYKYFMGKPEFEEVFDWFFNDTDTKPGSFIFACEALSLHPDNILRKLIKWSKVNARSKKAA